MPIQPVFTFCVAVNVLSAFTLLGCGGPQEDLSEVMVLTGGYVFDGERFEERDLFINGDTFRSVPTGKASAPGREISVKGQYLVPPYGDFHSHGLGSAYSMAGADKYLNEGTFYVQNLTDRYTTAKPLIATHSRPETVDVALSHGGLTSTHSHPHQLRERFALGLYSWGQRATPEQEEAIRNGRQQAGDAYWLLDSVADADTKVPKLLAHQPNIVKVFLLDVAAGVAKGSPAGHGLSPEVLVRAVELAHDADLRVVAHVETAADFRLALDAGVDGFAHLPGYDLTRLSAEAFAQARATGFAKHRLDAETIRLAGERGVMVNPTVKLSADNARWNFPDQPEALIQVRALQWEMIRNLDAAGARIVVGQDGTDGTAGEALYMAEHGLFAPAKMVKIWSQTTPSAIFPARKIGQLKPGYEASVLALKCDPTVDFACTQQIERRLKAGQILVDAAVVESEGTAD